MSDRSDRSDPSDYEHENDYENELDYEYEHEKEPSSETPDPIPYTLRRDTRYPIPRLSLCAPRGVC
jgi:hypothetical protein